MSLLGTVAGAIAGGASQLFNAGVNLWAGHKAQQGANDDRALAAGQFNAQMDETIQRRVADGLKAGINPLAAIGASANVSPTIHAGGSSGGAEYFSRAGEYLSRLFERKQADDIEYDNQAKELDLEGKRLENRILSNRLSAERKNLSGGVEDEKPNRTGDKPLFYPVYDLQGRPRLVVNQDVVEGDSDNAGYTASLLPIITDGRIDKVSGRFKSDQDKMMIDDMYYKMTGRHIANLDELYVSPLEVGIAGSNALGQSGIFKLFFGKK